MPRMGALPWVATSGSALDAAHVWLICRSRRGVYGGKSDARPRRRARPKNVALSLAKIYHSGKNSKPQVEKEMFPLARTAQSAGLHDTGQVRWGTGSPTGVRVRVQPHPSQLRDLTQPAHPSLSLRFPQMIPLLLSSPLFDDQENEHSQIE